MTVPSALLRMVRRGLYAKTHLCRNGGKNFPPNNSVMYDIYKRLQKQHKRRPTPDLKYQKKAIEVFARSRRFGELKKLASLERRFGARQLGLELETAMIKLGVGAMRKLDFDGEQVPTTAPKTWGVFKLKKF
jgi:hypothetical protein